MPSPIETDAPTDVTRSIRRLEGGAFRPSLLLLLFNLDLGGRDEIANALVVVLEVLFTSASFCTTGTAEAFCIVSFIAGVAEISLILALSFSAMSAGVPGGP
jgi:hypothetical protein